MPAPPATPHHLGSPTRTTARARPASAAPGAPPASSALATCSRIAACGSPTPAISASVSIRRSASAGEFACTVVSEPSCPVLSACSMSSASAPRTSPTTIRSGRIRSAFTTSCRIVTSPRPSTFAGRDSSRTTCRWRSRSSAASSIVTIRSSPGIAPDSAFERRRLARARSRRSPAPTRAPPRTAPAARPARPAACRARTSSRSEKPSRRKRRTVRHGPSSASGGITTFTREPSGSRASHSGDASSTRRPSGARIRSIACISSASPPNDTPVALDPPAPLDVHLPRPVHHHLVHRRIGQQRLERPQPGGEQQHPPAQRLALVARQRAGLALHQRAHLRVEPGAAGLPRPRPLDQPLAQRDGQVIERLHAR